MTLEDIEVDQEVICTSISKDIPFPDSFNREVGHIGKVRSVFPLKDAVLVEHIEMTGEGETGYVAFLTPFLVSELEIYEPEVKTLQRTIQRTLVQITRD